MKPRGKWQGMWTIARFNWPFYVAAVVFLIAASWGVFWFNALLGVVLCGFIIVGCLYFLIGSLGVSHQVYDRSDLYRWTWLERALHGASCDTTIFCHSGFDDASPHLREQLSVKKWVILDHYDATRMSEPSIRRARKLFPPTAETQQASYDQWPINGNTADLVFGFLAIHELRSEAERSAWFTEANRCLKTGGRVVLVEHTRDFENFLAFGPGFLHFHSVASWRRCWEQAGFNSIDEFHVTPWVRVFVISKS